MPQANVNSRLQPHLRRVSSPDARGAVAALGAAGDDLIDELLAWTGDRLKPAGARVKEER